MNIITIDKGASNPIYGVDVSGNLVVETPTRIARLGLQVSSPNFEPGSTNFVEINGTIGISSSVESPALLRVDLWRQIQIAPGVDGPEELVGSLNATVHPITRILTNVYPGATNITFDFVDGGYTDFPEYNTPKPVAEGYYAYNLYIYLDEPLDTTVYPIIDGPVQMAATSYVKNT